MDQAKVRRDLILQCAYRRLNELIIEKNTIEKLLFGYNYREEMMYLEEDSRTVEILEKVYSSIEMNYDWLCQKRSLPEAWDVKVWNEVEFLKTCISRCQIVHSILRAFVNRRRELYRMQQSRFHGGY